MPSSRRLELLPYVAGASSITARPDRANPFDRSGNVEPRMGADIKMGIGPNLTLDATINPDFGQVEADPAEVNLSGVETFFDEKRPFFTEGAGLLNLVPVENFFCSRRIGAPPIATASGDYVDAPAASTILGAAKLTGRTVSGTSIGALAAVTADEETRTFSLSSSSMTRVPVAPRTSFGVARVQQEFGRNKSTFANRLQRSVPRAWRTGEQLLRDQDVVLAADGTVGGWWLVVSDWFLPPTTNHQPG